MMMLTAVLFVSLGSAVGERWDLSHLARSRAGRDVRDWRGRGVLSNTVSGDHIADVSLLERCSRGRPDSDSYVSDRVLVYRDANGTQLSAYRGRNVSPLRYVHNVSLQLDGDGSLLLSAADCSGRSVASARVLGRGRVQTGLRRGFELFVRPLQGDAAVAAPSPPKLSLPGTRRSATARTAESGGSTMTRETYKVLDPPCPGGSCTLYYHRTGRCPSWYGAGLCTLEVEARSEPQWARWWRRLRGRALPEWEQQVETALRE